MADGGGPSAGVVALGQGLGSSSRPRVEEVRTFADFAHLETEWNALVEATGDEVFYRHEFLRIWIEAFAPEACLRVLVARDGTGTLVGVLPLMEERASLLGLPVRQLVSPANAHSCRCDLLAIGDVPTVAAAFLDHLMAERDWELLRLTNVPEGGNGFALLKAAAARGMAAGTIESSDSPFLPLPEGGEESRALALERLGSSGRRRRRKFAEQGSVSVDACTSLLELDGKLKEGLEVEASGWKGREGTAILREPRRRVFYTMLAREAARRGRLLMHLLRLDGRPVAFEYGLTGGRRYAALKVGYDEAFAKFSPGHLLTAEVVASCGERGLVEYDFLGSASPDKQVWTDRIRRHSWVVVFGSRLGRMLCPPGKGWMPKAKSLVLGWARPE